MKIKVFETCEGVELFFDEEKYDYSSNNMTAVTEALKKDLGNCEKDPEAASRAHNLLVIMKDMDRVRKVC